MNEETAHRAHPRVGRRRLRSPRDKGALVELEDSSHWQVSPGHEIFTEHWSPQTEITIVPGDYAEFPYDLINLKNGERVPAKYLGYADPDFGWSLVDDS
jgi:hypothetical protein